MVHISLLLLSHLNEYEQVKAGDGYHGEHPKHVKCPAGFASPVENENMQTGFANVKRQSTLSSISREF